MAVLLAGGKAAPATRLGFPLGMCTVSTPSLRCQSQNMRNSSLLPPSDALTAELLGLGRWRG
eukprot:4611101-Pleurochrysis_carterae.AAC.1